MSYELTSKALIKAIELRTNNLDYAGKALRLYIAGKHCDGFSYGICFDQPLEEDVSFEFDTIKLIVDQQTHTFTKNCHIDWQDTEDGSGFVITNPNQQKFRGKFFKRQVWQDYLKNNKANH